MRNFSMPRWSTVVDKTMDIVVGPPMRELRALRKAPAENASLPISNRLKMHGVGVTRYSFLFPFGRTSKTTFQTPERLWAPADGDDVNEGRCDAPAYDPQYFEPVPIHIEPKLKEAVNVFRHDDYQFSLLKKSAIRFARKAHIDQALLNELDQCGATLKTGKTDAKAARLPLLLSLRRACTDASEANGGQPMTEEDVTRALRYLRQQDLHASMVTPSSPADRKQVSEADQRAQDLAWRLAYKLAVTERGMDQLYRLTKTPMSLSATSVDAKKRDHQRRQHLHLKHFFKAADSLLDEHATEHYRSDATPLSAHPAGLLEHCYQQCEQAVAPANTLLIHGLTGIQTELCREHSRQPPSLWQQRIDHTAYRLHKNTINQQQILTLSTYSNLFDQTFIDKMTAELDDERNTLTALHRRQQAAMIDRFAFKWLSDGHISNAPGSILHNIEQRCEKIDVYQKRREERNERKGAKAFFKRSGEIIAAKNRTFFPAPQTDSLQHNPDSMVLHREVMQSALRHLEEMLMQGGGQDQHHPQPLDASRYRLENGPHRPILNNIVHLALIRHWLKQPLHYLSNNLELTQFEIDKLASPDNLLTLFGDNPVLVNEGPQRDAMIAAFKAILSKKILSPELLVQWAQQIAIDPPAIDDAIRTPRADRPVSRKSSAQLRDDFAASISHLQHGWKSSLAPSDDPLQHFKQMIAEQIEQMRLGNLRTISGGTSHGLNLPAFTVPVSLAKTLGLVKILVGGAYNHRGMVNLEVGIASWGGFIRVTTSNENQIGANIGVTAGPKAEWGTAIGGAAIYADVEGAGNGYRARGYCFCLPRGGAAMTGRHGSKPGVNCDAEVAAGLAKIWRILTDTADTAAAQQDQPPSRSVLRRIGEEVPDVSVSMVGPGDSHSEDGFIGVRVGTILGVTDDSKQYGVGLNASTSAIYSRRRMRYRQRNSALQVEVVNRTVRKSLNVQAALPLASGLGRKGGNAAAFNNGAESIAEPQFGTGGASAEIWKSGLGTQTNRIIYEGKISKNTYGNVFHPNAKPFCDAVEKNIAKWANHMAAHDPDCPALPATRNRSGDSARVQEVAEIRQGLVEKHTKAIRKYLARTKREVHPSDVYFDFLELTPEATDLLNHYYESEIEFRAAGCNAEADACKRALDAVWKHDDAWAPYFIVNSSPQQSNSGASFNLVLSASSEQPNSSNRFYNYCG